jgi:hypothetical protein
MLSALTLEASPEAEKYNETAQGEQLVFTTAGASTATPTWLPAVCLAAGGYNLGAWTPNARGLGIQGIGSMRFPNTTVMRFQSTMVMKFPKITVMRFPKTTVMRFPKTIVMRFPNTIVMVM